MTTRLLPLDPGRHEGTKKVSRKDRAAPKSDLHISVPEMRSALIRSGYLLEERVKRQFQKQRFFAEANFPFRDPDSGKTRELDIRAFEVFTFDDYGDDVVAVEVLADCENNPEPVVFLQTRADHLWPDAVVKCNGTPPRISTDTGGWYSLVRHFDMRSFHHYWTVPTASQYLSFQRNKADRWMAVHDANQHQSFTGVIAKTDEWMSVEPEGKADDPVRLTLYYPVLIFQGAIYLAQETRHSVSLRKIEHAIYLRDIVSGHTQRTYVIDVMTESFVPQFIKMVKAEGRRVRDRAKADVDLLRSSWQRTLSEKPQVPF